MAGEYDVTEAARTPDAAAAQEAPLPGGWPSPDRLEQELIAAILDPPDLGFARELLRDLPRRVKPAPSRLLLADALRRLPPQHRGSRPRDRGFVRSALLQRLSRATDWLAQPLAEPLPPDPVVGADALPNGSWSWQSQGLALMANGEGNWGVLHLSLHNHLEAVGVGQPLAVVLADADRTYSWSPVASGLVPLGVCLEECRGSLASVAVEGHGDILGHLTFPLPQEAIPTHWGLRYGEEIELRPVPPPTMLDSPSGAFTLDFSGENQSGRGT